MRIVEFHACDATRGLPAPETSTMYCMSDEQIHASLWLAVGTRLSSKLLHGRRFGIAPLLFDLPSSDRVVIRMARNHSAFAERGG